MSDSDKEDQTPSPELDVPESDEVLDEEPELDEWWSWGNFARLFIFPLIIVIVSVLIYGTFQYLMRDQRSVTDFIAQIRTGSENQRWRAAFELAQEVRMHGRQKEFTQSSANAIINLYMNAEEPKIKQYLAFVLAELPLEDSIEALKKGLQSSKPGVKVNAMLALGKLNENAESERIKKLVVNTAPEVATLLNDKSAEVRRMAAFVLGSIGNEDVKSKLKKTLDDNADDVRWNGAIALGRMGDPAGKSILIGVLKKSLNDTLPSMSSKLRRNLLQNTMIAIRELNTQKAVPLLRKIKEQDPDPKVRKRALKILKHLT